MQTVTVIGATGKTGRAVARAALAHGLAVRGTSRHPGPTETKDAVAPAAGLAGIDWRVAGIATGHGLAEAFIGADAAYLIMPNVHPQEESAISRAAVAAREAGVARIVYHSVVDPDDARMAHHLRKGRAEAAVREVFGDAVVLRPSAYLQNLSGAALAGALRVPYRLDRPFTLVDLDDVALVAGMALRGDPELSGATVELAGPQDLTVSELAEAAAEVLGHPVVAERTPLPDWIAGPGAGMPSSERDDLVAMFSAYDESGLTADPAPLRELLGRPATSWTQHLVGLMGPHSSQRRESGAASTKESI